MKDPDKRSEMDGFCVFAYCVITALAVALILIDAILL